MQPAPTHWTELAPLLDEALDLSAQEREPWLARLDATRPEVSRELREMLALHAQLAAEGFLESGPLSRLTVPRSLAGQRIGAYTLDSLLGAGGMGTVWLAHRSDGRFEGRVAIKLLNIALVGRPSELRFVREGNLLARLQHPNIARLVDAGVAESGQPYLVLEYVEGERIDAHCERLGLDVAARIRLFLDVLAAVAHAHSHLIVHRDLKPPNILVTPAGVVKLLDFGVGALLAAESETSELTREAGSALTPEYAAPEQWIGSSTPITTATDVYALGLVLFDLLVGHHPHPPRERDKARADAPRAPLHLDAPLASELTDDPRLRAALRGDLDNIIAMALKSDPAERYPTAAALADDLRRHLAHEPVQARPGSFAYRAGKLLRRQAVEIGVSLVIALALVGTTVFALLQMFDARQQRDNAGFEARRAEASSEFMSLVFEEVGPTGAPQSLEQLLDRGVNLLEHQNGSDPAILSRMLVQASRRYQDVGRVDKQLRILDRAVDLAKVSGAPEVLATALCAGVLSEIEHGSLAAARERLSRATEALAGAHSPPIGSQVDCMRASAEILLEENNAPAALETETKARAMLESAGNTRGLQYTSVLTDIGGIYYRMGRYADALPMSERAAEAFERNGRGGTVGMTISLENIATDLYSMGEVLASDARYRELLARETAARSGRLESVAANNRGGALVRLEKFAEAQPFLEEAITSARADGSRIAETYALTNLARLNTREGDFAAAERTFGVLDGYFAAAPDDNREAQLAAAEARIELEVARGDVSAARTRADALLSAIDYPRKRVVPLLKRLLPALARLSLLEGDPARAQTYAAEALTIAQKLARPGGHSADVGEATLLMGEAQRLTGHSEEARRSTVRTVEDLEASLGPEHSLTREAKTLRASL